MGPMGRIRPILLILFILGGILRSGVLVEIQIQCPHCGEIITSMADTSQGDYSTIEDCEVCCAPMTIEVTCEPGRVEEVRVTLA
jgi:Cysteine-rich CPXCG